MGVYSVKYGNKSLEDKNNSNEIFQIGFSLEVNLGDFPFLDVQKGGRSHLTTPSPRDAFDVGSERYQIFLHKNFNS